MKTKAYAAFDSTSPLGPFEFNRRALTPQDVHIKILYCGVCHSDLHTVNGDWGPMPYPVVPGHEIVGQVVAVGSQVKNHKVGDSVGVGCYVDSCRKCPACLDGDEQYCEKGMIATYASFDPKTQTVTQGGYSDQIVVDENYVLKVPPGLPLERVAPLLCAGITTYSPLRAWDVKRGDVVAVAGLGGLGHMAVKLAVAMGAEVTVLSTSESKRKDALALGAQKFAIVKSEKDLKPMANQFDFILNTISAAHDYNMYLSLLKRNGTMVLVGLPGPQAVSAGSLIRNRRSLAGSLIGGVAETQDMLNFCGEHNIAADVEVIRADQINEAYKRMVKNDVHYRFVIDLASL
jgi:uncharacterized zinc-type alcohol dehydrogenase-like protein